VRKNPAELLLLGNPRKRKNPAEILVFGNPRKRTGSTRRNGNVEELYQDFHQMPSDRTLVRETPQDTPKKLMVLGDLVALGFGNEDMHGNILDSDQLAGGTVQNPVWARCSHISFNRQDVKVACDAPKSGLWGTRGRQLYFIGGDQALSTEQLNQFTGKRTGVAKLGPAYFIVYNSTKAADGGDYDGYVHTFGEEGGRRPTAYYDTANKQILLRGGSYEIRAEGIVN